MPAIKQKKQTNKDFISNKQYIKWYEEMQLYRKFEEKAGQMYGLQKIRGFCHLYIGQEAVVAGTMAALEPGDKIITAYRDHAHALAAGISAREVMAELYGKATGCSKGKGGSMHMFSKEKGFFGGHGIVGAQIPMGAGIAFAEKYKNTGKICVTSMGDGAVRQGALHETFTMAMLWEIPVVFICENNRYGMGTSVERTTNVPDLYKIASAYDMPSAQVDGMKCEDVYFAMKDAAELARKENIPSFLEIKTYRYKGHSMSDAAKYRTREELEQFKQEDPIDNILKYILENNILTQGQIEGIDEAIKKEVDDAVQFAEDSPYPDVSELYQDIYTQQDYPFLVD